jgi:hypothetical protein
LNKSLPSPTRLIIGPLLYSGSTPLPVDAVAIADAIGD